MKKIALILLNLVILSSTISFAAEVNKQGITVAQNEVSSATMALGEVKKVDKELGKITIKHEPLQHLGMPAMTMIFRVKENAILDQVKAGDKIQFSAEQVAGGYMANNIKVVK